MIEVSEGTDTHGFYFLRARGQVARSMAALAAAIGCAPEELLLRPKLLKTAARDLNTAEAVARRGGDFDPFS